jgi:predicted transcriptional regulator
MAATTTIRLPPELQARRSGAADRALGAQPDHQAVERHADYEEQMQSFVKEALAADEDIEKTGEVYRAADVHAWMQRLAAEESPARPKSCRR